MLLLNGGMTSIIFTQVRKPSIDLVMADLGLPLEKTHTIMEEWGYTGSACIPMALDDALQKGLIPKGALTVFVGSGVGYKQAAAAFKMKWTRGAGLGAPMPALMG